MTKLKLNWIKYMTGMKKVSLILLLLILLPSCSKQVCVSHSVWTVKCEKKIDWTDPKIKVIRSIITNGISAN